MTGQTDDGAHEQGKAMKRWGILAAAGAVMAGLVAKQATQPVAALDPNDLALGTSNSTGGATTLTYTGLRVDTQNILSVTDGTVLNPPWPAAVAGYADNNKALIGIYGYSNGIVPLSAGVVGNGTGYAPGVFGDNSFVGSGYSNYGVYGRSHAEHGVYGETFASPYSDKAGIYGMGNGAGTYGVFGNGDIGSGIGVQGQSDETGGIGVQGVSSGGYPIIGMVSSATGFNNINPAVLGVGTKGPGVQGQSPSGYGLVGFTNAIDGHAGLIGYANQAGGIGLIGNAPGGASPGLAGVFNGDVIVNGALRVFGSPKNAAVKNPTDNSYRLLYCEESPESWFADYGEAKLANGKADVKLDPTFAALIHADTYHVFLTSHDPDSKGLAIAGRRLDGFAVQEHMGGTSGGTFSYRVVAKRKDIAGERLAKVDPPPPLKPVTPFTVPQAPDIKPPAKKP